MVGHVTTLLLTTTPYMLAPINHNHQQVTDQHLPYGQKF